jgi:hypothetical protein
MSHLQSVVIVQHGRIAKKIALSGTAAHSSEEERSSRGPLVAPIFGFRGRWCEPRSYSSEKGHSGRFSFMKGKWGGMRNREEEEEDEVSMRWSDYVGQNFHLYYPVWRPAMLRLPSWIERGQGLREPFIPRLFGWCWDPLKRAQLLCVRVALGKAWSYSWSIVPIWRDICLSRMHMNDKLFLQSQGWVSNMGLYDNSGRCYMETQEGLQFEAKTPLRDVE